MAQLKILGVIPARLGSTRLPGKVIRLINGKPMIEHVYHAALACELLDDVVVATDSTEVITVCEQRGLRAIMTGEHNSGSDRVYEVMTQTHADIYLNLQGDEPMLDPSHIRLLATPFVEETQIHVTTLCVRITAHEAANPNVVKVVRNDLWDALYFSRSVIPFDRDGEGRVGYLKHLGLYGFTRAALEKFHRLKPTELEEAERLEQLRILSNGIPIRVIETTRDTIAVDTEEDLARVEAAMSR